MSKHTPGPWIIYDTGNRAETYGVESTNGTAVVWYGSNEKEGIRKLADAQLIAASPDLLAACQAAIEELEHVRDNADGVDLEDTISALQDAICKATGYSDECPPTPRTDLR